MLFDVLNQVNREMKGNSSDNETQVLESRGVHIKIDEKILSFYAMELFIFMCCN